jgi:hypothetical protein
MTFSITSTCESITSTIQFHILKKVNSLLIHSNEYIRKTFHRIPSLLTCMEYLLEAVTCPVGRLGPRRGTGVGGLDMEGAGRMAHSLSLSQNTPAQTKHTKWLVTSSYYSMSIKTAWLYIAYDCVNVTTMM